MPYYMLAFPVILQFAFFSPSEAGCGICAPCSPCAVPAPCPPPVICSPQICPPPPICPVIIPKPCPPCIVSLLNHFALIIRGDGLS
ncbi:unnamed protein product [Gongylonema pulchrum]|uniref:IGFBP N-terminal domain-containing protein n=1 Tax=Gongylonema pulchrum TaxID=637853 RepID=A0A183CVG7_9BILA|nr:unnamed protein product [Gongylonema pulchrum]